MPHAPLPSFDVLTLEPYHRADEEDEEDVSFSFEDVASAVQQLPASQPAALAPLQPASTAPQLPPGGGAAAVDAGPPPLPQPVANGAAPPAAATLPPPRLAPLPKAPPTAAERRDAFFELLRHEGVSSCRPVRLPHHPCASLCMRIHKVVRRPAHASLHEGRVGRQCEGSCSWCRIASALGRLTHRPEPASLPCI